MDRPSGFDYEAEFLTPIEAARLERFCDDAALESFRFRGVVARRRVAHFGFRYSFDGRGLEPGPPIPKPLLELRRKAAAWAGLREEELEQVLVSEYPPGAGIGWHRDAPPFGSVILGVSLGGPARLRLRRGGAGAWEVYEAKVTRGSIYKLSGESRWKWQHGVPPVKERRFSITFRTLKTPAKLGSVPESLARSR